MFIEVSPILVTNDVELAAAIKDCGPGSVVKLAPGTYRQPLHVQRGGSSSEPLCIEAVESGTVIFNGAVPVRDWELVGPDRWKAVFQITAEQRLEEHFGRITQPVQVWVGGRRVEQAASLQKLKAGQFFWEGDILTLQLGAGENPYMDCIEVARHGTMLKVEASHVILRGITVTRCAASVQIAGAVIEGDHNIVEYCEFSQTAAGVGVRFKGKHICIRRNRIHHNGQMGFTFIATKSSFEDNHVHDNDVRGFCGHPEAEWHVWECGGGKVAFTHHCVFRGNRFIDNLGGPGLWLDIDNYHNRIESNYFSNNGHSAIMIEISRENTVCNNIIADTRESNYSAAGVLVQLSCRTHIHHNLFLRSEGFGVHLRWHVRNRDIHPYEPADPEEFAALHGFRQEEWMTPDGQYPVAENHLRNNVFIDCRRGAIQLDAHAKYTYDNSSDYNLFWNAHNMHPMAGGHRLLEWQEMTGLDEHSLYSKEMHYGPLLCDEVNGDLRPHPEGPLAVWRVPALKEVPLDFNAKPRSLQTTAGHLEHKE